MGLVATESINTGGFTTSDDAQSTSATRVFTVVSTDDSGSPVASTELEAIGACEIGIGSEHPDYNTLICRDINVTRETGHIGVFRCTFVYKYPDTIDPGGPPDTDGGGAPFQTAVNLNFRGKFEKLWRVDPNPEAEPYTGGDSGEDIGGVAVDAFGEVQRTTLIVKAQVQTTMRLRVRITDSVNYITRLQQFVGTRNSETFLGAQPGTLLYVGSNSRRISGNLYEFTHTIEFDKFKHQEQAPTPGVGPFGVELGSDDPNQDSYVYRRRAFPVKWVQPYPQLNPFSALAIDISL
jgi:hypothetical protein